MGGYFGMDGDQRNRVSHRHLYQNVSKQPEGGHGDCDGFLGIVLFNVNIKTLPTFA